MSVTQELIADVNKRLFTPFQDLPVRKTDLGVLFGCRSASGTVAREAAALYKREAFPKIMVFGGKRVCQPLVLVGLNREQRSQAPMKDYFSLATEAEYMRRVLIANDVPEDDIVFVGAGEKHADKICAQLSAQLQGDFADVTSLSAVTYSPYSRRTVGTMRMQGIDLPVDVRPVHPFGLKPESWQHSQVAKYVVQEARNMNPINPDGHVGKYTTAVDLDAEAALRESLPVLDG